MYKVEILTEEYAIEMCKWKYHGEYSVYNIPSREIITQEKRDISNQKERVNQFYAFTDENRILCGVIRIQDKKDWLKLGLGLKPELCGLGLGDEFIKHILNLCKELHPNKKIVLDVRTFNIRAIKCYQKAGFKIVDTIKLITPTGMDDFVKMEFIEHNERGCKEMLT